MRISDWSSDVCSSDLTISPKLTPLCSRSGGGKVVVAAMITVAAAGIITSAMMPCHGSAADRKKPASTTTRSEERRVGQESASTGNYRWCSYTTKQKLNNTNTILTYTINT